ncbi:beta-lactamase [Xylariales sp. PMI_506]|nr:beta-lactamase [Xylariales sp. PMI_506]
MAELQQILEAYVGTPQDTKDKLLGAAFILLDKNGILFQGSAGHETFAPDAPSYSTGTVTWIASMTKVITATCLLQLVESGQVTLDEDVRLLVPELAQFKLLKGIDEAGAPIVQDNDKPVTLRQLLTHTSGLIYPEMSPDIIKWAAIEGVKINSMAWSLEGFSSPFIYPPGQGWSYGPSTDWASKVLQKVTGQSLSQYLDEHIAKPLGMENTTFYPTKRDDLKNRLAAFAYRTQQTNGSLVPGPTPTAFDFEFESGGAGLFSTPADYAKFFAAVLKGNILLKKETTELLFAPQLDDIQRTAMTQVVSAAQNIFAPEYPPGLPIDFSFGGMMNMQDVPGKRRKGSVMWSGFANSHWWYDLESGIVGILFTTVMADPPGDPIVIKLYDSLEAQVYKQLAKQV